MPQPNKGESKENYLSRCMGDKSMRQKYPDSDQRYAICNGIWDDGGDKGSASPENASQNPVDTKNHCGTIALG